MRDACGRTIRYLRISVTDRCNYRCRYCMGEDGVSLHTHAQMLTFEEIAEIVAACAQLGIDKVRLTGGEPLVRRGIATLCAMLKGIPGISELTLTTNGSLLPLYASDLKAAGVDRLNISLDTLDPEKFRLITRVGTLSDVLDGLDAAERAGFLHTKLNVVLIGGFNNDEIGAFVEMTKDRALSVRFIELMPIGDTADWDAKHFLPSSAVLAAVPALERIDTDGVAVRYRVPGYVGTVGLIPPMSEKLCDRCNRIRLTADGKLKPCLHSAQEVSLKGLHKAELFQTLKLAIYNKPKEHHMDCLHPSGSVRRMYEIGG